MAGAPAWTRVWPALPALLVVVFVLLRLGFDDGGYFPAAFTSAGAIAFLALAVLVVRPAHERFPTQALIAIGALAAFACWTGLSRLWSVLPDAPLLDMQRAMLYVALFGLALLAADSSRNARLLVWCVLGVVIVIAGAGLLSRLQPDIVRVTVDPFVAPFYRLDHPLGYWNALGALASIGTVLALGLAAAPRGHVILRGAAAGAAVLLAVTMYLTLSRGAWLAIIVGLVVLVAIAPNRGSLLLTLAIAGGTAAAAIVLLRGYPALVLDPKAGRGQAAQGSVFTRQLLALVLLAVTLQAALAAARASALLEDRMRTIRRIALIGGATLLLVGAAAGYATKGGEAEGAATSSVDDATGWLDRQWQDFLDPAAYAGEGKGAARLLTAKGARSDGYRVAIDGFESSPLIGRGAGSFEVRYARDRDVDVRLRDAHSLPLETLGELGAGGMALLLGFFGAVAAAGWRAIRGKGMLHPAEAAAVIAAFAVWLGHASVDWDWEMPALTGTAIVLSGALFGRGRRRRSRGRRAAAPT